MEEDRSPFTGTTKEFIYDCVALGSETFRIKQGTNSDYIIFKILNISSNCVFVPMGMIFGFFCGIGFKALDNMGVISIKNKPHQN